MKKILFLFSISLLISSCVSTRSTIKNIDDSAPDLIVKGDNTFEINQFGTEKKYGYDKDYPINIFYKTTNTDANQERFLIAFAKKQFTVLLMSATFTFDASIFPPAPMLDINFTFLRLEARIKFNFGVTLSMQSKT